MLVRTKRDIGYKEDMITELICYKCKCSKCNHLWTTKGHELPKACPNPKCKRITWNDDFDFSKSPVSVPNPEPIPKVAEPIQNDLTAFIAKAQALKGIAPSEITSEPEPIEEHWQFTKEKVWYDDLNTPNRRQWLVGSKNTFRIVEVGEFDHSYIERIK